MTEPHLPSRVLIIRLIAEGQPDIVAIGEAPNWVDRPYIGEYVIVPGVSMIIPIMGISVGTKMIQFLSEGFFQSVEKRDKLVAQLEAVGFMHGEAGTSLIEKPVSDDDDGDEYPGLYI